MGSGTSVLPAPALRNCPSAALASASPDLLTHRTASDPPVAPREPFLASVSPAPAALLYLGGCGFSDSRAGAPTARPHRRGARLTAPTAPEVGGGGLKVQTWGQAVQTPLCHVPVA